VQSIRLRVEYQAVSRVVSSAPGYVIGYLRTAAGEAEPSLESQRASIERWAVEHDVIVAAWAVDASVFGGAPVAERPGLVAALRAIATHGAKGVVAACRSRVATDAFVERIVEQAVHAAGAQVYYSSMEELATGHLETRAAEHVSRGDRDASPAGQAYTRGAVSLLASYQRAVHRARTRDALAAKQARGERVGAVPYGYRVAPDGVRLERDEAEQEVLRYVRELASAGLSQRQIVKDLEARGVVGRTGMPLRKTQIARLLHRVAA